MELGDINAVKYLAYIENPENTRGYVMDEFNLSLVADVRNPDYRTIQEWIAEGGVVDDAFTSEELQAYQVQQNGFVYESMVAEGQRINQENQVCINLDTLLLIEDVDGNQAWMQDLYLTEVSQKPPATMRQLLNIYGQNERDYVVERTEVLGEYGWIITLIQSDSTTPLSLAVCDAGGTVLEELVFGVCWRGVCVSTSLTTTEEPLFYKFIADGDITGVLEQEADENGAGMVVWGDYD